MASGCLAPDCDIRVSALFELAKGKSTLPRPGANHFQGCVKSLLTNKKCVFPALMKACCWYWLCSAQGKTDIAVILLFSNRFVLRLLSSADIIILQWQLLTLLPHADLPHTAGVSDMANGGQVLLDEPTCAAVREWLAELGLVDHAGYNDQWFMRPNMGMGQRYGLADPWGKHTLACK